MPTFSVQCTTPAAATAAGYATLHTGANRRGFVRQIVCTATAATYSPVGLGIPANTPTATTSILGQALDAADAAATINIDTAWSTAPTAPTVLMQKRDIPAVAGAGIVFDFPADHMLTMAKSTWLVLWNYSGSTGAALDVSVLFDE